MTLPSVTITFTRYREPDWLIADTLDSLAKQSGIRGEVLFLDQRWSQAEAEAVMARSTANIAFKCEKCPEKGLSHARNLGLERAENDIVLFIDPDAIAEPDWAARMAQALSQPGAAIAGSRILPRWRGREPFIARAKIVRDQYSLLDWGTKTKPAHRVVGAGFGVRKSAAPSQMYFDTGLGRRDGKLFSGEESDLCARVSESGAAIVYEGKALVHHQILPERQKLSWVLKRLYYAGLGRGQNGGAPNPSQSPGWADWMLLPLILPPYALGWLSSRRST
ncbi:MAG: glycosyltransferase [Pseudomonadota bacterium]